MKKLTKEMLLKVCPGAAKSKLNIDLLVTELNRIFDIQKNPTSDLSNEKRRAGFISQCAHESGQFTLVVENLNYSLEGLMKVFPSRFPTKEVAEQYARNPEKIANFIYSNRMGNGTPESGDGWKYRGRGFIQLTGRSNYTQFSKDTGIDAVNNPDLLLAVPGAVESAYWFWTKNSKLNTFADTENIGSMTKTINGGHHGLQERTDYFHKALKVLTE